ncbi:MAG: hypothetical protein GWM98_09180 [Nitrospinaceae bacterium]|nr:hypothetical protein [Nitrospinaceae bacterium]NIR54632.1 hypothetical protein [Nitrospinaceae bacterium]NIS85049.1 hypothetical protein [Nitrospinaceae bacterium]NIT81865.1 hypothetical protein [Nitrospinaceae bacterium]NIU44130.1 hypothetical protein [Nitrospinaceae bacterium]
MEKLNKKKPKLRSWIRDRILFLALIIFVGGATLYISSARMFAPDSIWLHPVKEFGLLIAMIGVVSLGYELFLRELTFSEYKEALQDIVNPHAVRLGIQGIYKNRSEIGQAHTFQNLFREVKHEVFIGGTSLLSISTGSRDLLKEKVLGGIKVRLLVIDPDSEIVEIITRQIGGKSTFKNEIKTSLLLLQKLQEEIEEAEAPGKGRMAVHTYQTIPAHSFFSIDVDEPHGIIITDLGPYLGRNHQRPSMYLINKKKGLYDHYRVLNQTLWEESTPLKSGTPEISGPKTKTQVFTSGKATEYFDVETDSWRKASLCELNSQWRGIQGSRWVWVRENITLEEAKTGSQNRFRMQFDIPDGKAQSVKRAELFVRSDDTCHITVNDVSLKQEYGGADYPDPFIINFDQFLKEGTNTVTFEVINYAKPDAEVPEDNPSGLIYRLHLEVPE